MDPCFVFQGFGHLGRDPTQALRLQVHKQCLLKGLKHINDTSSGLFGAPAYTSMVLVAAGGYKRLL